jgi:hypothetical protein
VSTCPILQKSVLLMDHSFDHARRGKGMGPTYAVHGCQGVSGIPKSQCSLRPTVLHLVPVDWPHTMLAVVIHLDMELAVHPLILGILKEALTMRECSSSSE